jgi:hypothetical protein
MNVWLICYLTAEDRYRVLHWHLPGTFAAPSQAPSCEVYGPVATLGEAREQVPVGSRQVASWAPGGGGDFDDATIAEAWV